LAYGAEDGWLALSADEKQEVLAQDDVIRMAEIWYPLCKKT
jgi:hypothetical protein